MPDPEGAAGLPSTYTVCTLVDGRVVAQERDLAPLLSLRSAVVIRVLKMGVCRADIKEVNGARDIPEDRGPLFGHEVIGQIATNTVPGLDIPVGTTVTFNPNVTPRRSAGFADYMFVQGEARTLAECIIPLFDQSAPDLTWIPEPLACIVHAVDSSSLSSLTYGDRVAIIGAGCSGTLFSMYCRHLGADVAVFNRGQDRLEFLLSNQLADASTLHSLSEAEGFSRQFDYVIIATTKIERPVMDSAHNLLKAGGTILLYGGTQSDDRWLGTTVNIDAIRRQETRQLFQANDAHYWLAGAYGCSTRDFVKAMRLVREEQEHFCVSRLADREIELHDLPSVINRMADGADRPGKIIVYSL